MDCGEATCAPPPSARTMVNSKVMVVAVLVLFGVVLFILCLHIYAKWFWRTHSAAVTAQNAQAAAVAQQMGTTTRAGAPQSVGLERAVVEALPTFEYSAEKKEKEPLECAVCLEDFELGEQGRTLPKCGHSFHLECIDMWLHSHSTCPICRVSAAPEEEKEEKTEAVMVEIPDDQQQEVPVVGDVGAPFMAVMRQHRRSRRANSLPRTDVGETEESAAEALVLEQRLKEFETPPPPLQVTIEIGGSSSSNVASVLSPMARASASFRRLLSRGKTVVTPQDEAEEGGPSSSPRDPSPRPPPSSRI